MKTPQKAKEYVEALKPETMAEARSYAMAYWEEEEKEECKGGWCCQHGFRCQELYPEGCHVHVVVPYDLEKIK